MPKLNIDGQDVQVSEGATVLEAARSLGVEVPTLCHRNGFEPSTSCMVCVMKINGSPVLAPSCATPATDGMVVESESDEVRSARRTALELLLSDHAGDCVAPCQRADANHLDIPLFIRQVAVGDLPGAAATLEAAGIDMDDLADLDMRSAEVACRRARLDETLGIGDLIRHVASKARGTTERGEAPPPYREFSVRLGKLTDEEMDELLADASRSARVTPTDSNRVLSDEEARAEALRCLHCDCRDAHSCALRNACEALSAQTSRFLIPRPRLEVDRSHPDILHEPGKCIRCGLCLQVVERAGEAIGLAFVGRGYDMRVQVPFDAPLSEALKQAALECADVCPVGALARVFPV